MAPTRTGSKRLLRDLNQSIVFNLIASEKSISRTEVARKSGLPAATITRIVNSFIAAGLVFEVQSEESSGGRRPVLLSINPSAIYAVGVKLRENGLTITICDLNCTIIRASEQAFPAGGEPHQIVEIIASTIKQFIRDAGLLPRQILGVGVGLGGWVDSQSGLCRYSAILGWQNVELGPALEFKLRVPVRVDNDVNTLAVAERLFGAGQKVSNFVLVTAGRGIGLGIIMGGEIYRGTHGGAGEFGHMTIDISDTAPYCSCGKRGCLEAIASDYGILRAALGEDPGHNVTEAINALIERAQAGDSVIQDIFHRAGKALGIAVANVINLFDPALVLISGEGLRAGELFLNSFHAALPQHIFGPQRNMELIIKPIDDTIWARGAASLVLREVFQAPIYDDDGALVIDDLLSQSTQSQSTQTRRRSALT